MITLKVETTSPQAPEVSLSWTPSTGAQGYNIYRSTTPGKPVRDSDLIGTVDATGTHFVDHFAAQGDQKVYYQVVAVSDSGETLASNVAEIAKGVAKNLALLHPDQPASVTNPSVQVAQTTKVTTIISSTATVVGVATSLVISQISAALLSGDSPLNVLQYMFFLLGLGGRLKRKWGNIYSKSTKLPISGATIGLVPQGLNRGIKRTVSDPTGAYAFFLQQSGDYKLAVSAVGFASYTGTTEKIEANSAIAKRVFTCRSRKVANMPFHISVRLASWRL